MASSLPSSLARLRHRSPALPAARRSFATTSPKSRSLAASVQLHHSYILLHNHRPPPEYEARPKSQLQRALMLKAREWGGLVNFSWSPDQPVSDKYTGLPGEGREEAFAATAFFTKSRKLELPEVSLANLDEVAVQMREFALHNDQETTRKPKLHLYVCTHGARDCRCGETGGEVEKALRSEIERRGISENVKLGSVAHVGGHEFAANIMVFPFGDWLGTVQESDVPSVLDEILERHASLSVYETTAPPVCPPFWRGRMGLDKDQQLALISR